MSSARRYHLPSACNPLEVKHGDLEDARCKPQLFKQDVGSGDDGCASPLGLLRVEAHKIPSVAAAFRLSEAGLGRGAIMCVRVIYTRMRIVSSLPLRAGRSHTVNADGGSHCALVSQRFFLYLFFFLRIENVCFFFLRFWLFLSSSRFQ